MLRSPIFGIQSKRRRPRQRSLFRAGVDELRVSGGTGRRCGRGGGADAEVDLAELCGDALRGSRRIDDRESELCRSAVARIR